MASAAPPRYLMYPIRARQKMSPKFSISSYYFSSKFVRTVFVRLSRYVRLARDKSSARSLRIDLQCFSHHARPLHPQIPRSLRPVVRSYSHPRLDMQYRPPKTPTSHQATLSPFFSESASPQSAFFDPFRAACLV